MDAVMTGTRQRALLELARGDAVAVLREVREVRKAGQFRSNAADPKARPAYWVGQLEGVMLVMVASVDLAFGDDDDDDSNEATAVVDGDHLVPSRESETT